MSWGSIDSIRKSRIKYGGNKKRNRTKQSIEFVNSMAIKLQQKTPYSEKWFHQRFKNYRDKNDLYNESFFGLCIPDIWNKHYKYIIEIDGAIHYDERKPEIAERDRKKDERYRSLGYTVFRIQAFNKPMFKEVLNEILKLRLEFEKTKKEKAFKLKYSKYDDA